MNVFLGYNEIVDVIFSCGGGLSRNWTIFFWGGGGGGVISIHFRTFP